MFRITDAFIHFIAAIKYTWLNVFLFRVPCMIIQQNNVNSIHGNFDIFIQVAVSQQNYII